VTSSLVESEISAKLVSLGKVPTEVSSVYAPRVGGKSHGASLLSLLRASKDILQLVRSVRRFRKISIPPEQYDCSFENRGGLASWLFSQMPPFIKYTFLLAVLVIHFLTRYHTAVVIPSKRADFLVNTANYTDSYQISLALLAGKGFHRLNFPLPAPDAAEKLDIAYVQAARPVLEFIYSGRTGLTKEGIN